MNDMARLAQVFTHLSAVCLWETMGRPTKADAELQAAVVAAVGILNESSRTMALRVVRFVTVLLKQGEDKGSD